MERSFPGFREFSILEPDSSDDDALSVDETFDHLGMYRGEVEVTGDVPAGLWIGASKEPDILWSGLAHPVAISARLEDALAASGITGWSSVPYTVEINGRLEKTSYRLWSIHGRCGPIDSSRSVIREREFPGGRFPMVVGRYFEPSSWDGSDLFLSPSDTLLYVTRKTVDLMTRLSVNGVGFTSLDLWEAQP